ncbi:MAG: PhnD/SsuA/transferrin family substrate-binding protein [Pseudomonadota bacterium]
MRASLPMYDPPHLRAVNDAFWTAIRAALPFEAPQTLTRSDDIWALWTDAALLLSQTCSLPYRARLRGRVHLVGTPDYGLPGCPPGHYNSTIVTRADTQDIAGARLAFNDGLSQSGWGNAQGLGAVAALETGSHAASLQAVVRGDADVAVIDSHTLRILGLPPELRARGLTQHTPATPYITSRAEWVAPLRAALAAALDTLVPAERAALGIRQIVDIPDAEYGALPSVAAPKLPENP